MPKKSILSSVIAAKKETSHRSVFFIEGIPRTTKIAFKKACVANDIAMRDVVITMMRLYAEGKLKDFMKQMGI